MVENKPIAADWAIERALEETGHDFNPTQVKEYPEAFKSLYTLAIYIEKHEEPPFDEDVAAVDSIIKAWYLIPQDRKLDGFEYRFDKALAKYKELKK